MSISRVFTIDTNFFIAGFGETPGQYEILNKIFRNLNIKIYVPNYVRDEMRWYMRRSIEPLLTVINVNAAKLAKFEKVTAGKVDIKLPQTPDMAVAYLADQEDIPLVSSDLRLVEVSQQIGVEAMMNSAFLVMIRSEITNDTDREFVQKLYEKIFSDEITYSVKSQSRYDPVVRIQKIMESTLNVVRQQAAITKKATKLIKSDSVDPSTIPTYQELKEATSEVRTDIDKYVKILEEGNYAKLGSALKIASAHLIDLATEVRMAGIEEEDPVYKESLTTVAHLQLMEAAVALGEQQLDKVEAISDLLLLLLLENDEVEARLDIEVHLLRITLFFLTEQLSRLKYYFTPTFQALCMKRDRQDILNLHRTMSILMIVLATKQAEKSATVRDFAEIQYVIQLGTQFMVVGKVQNAWLLFEQAVYMSLNSKMTGLLFAVFEVMLPLSFKIDHTFEPSFASMLKLAKKSEKKLSFDDFIRRSKPNHKISEDLLRPRFIQAKNLPTQFTGFLDVISAEKAEFKRIGRCVFIRAIDWQTMHFVGIVDPSKTLDENLTVGSSIQLYSGNFRVISPAKSIKESRNVDLLIIGKQKNAKFLIRRAGQVTVSQSRVLDYDL